MKIEGIDEEIYRICTPCTKHLGLKPRFDQMSYNMATCDHCKSVVATTKMNNWTKEENANRNR